MKDFYHFKDNCFKHDPQEYIRNAMIRVIKDITGEAGRKFKGISYDLELAKVLENFSSVVLNLLKTDYGLQIKLNDDICLRLLPALWKGIPHKTLIWRDIPEAYKPLDALAVDAEYGPASQSKVAKRIREIAVIEKLLAKAEEIYENNKIPVLTKLLNPYTQILVEETIHSKESIEEKIRITEAMLGKEWLNIINDRTVTSEVIELAYRTLINYLKEDNLLLEGKKLQYYFNEPKSAIICFNQILEKNSKYIPALVQKALSLSSLGEKEAIKIIDQAMLINPSYAPAYYNKIVILCNLNRHEEAKKLLEMHEIESSIIVHDAEDYFTKANALFMLNKYKEAIGCCEKAISLDSKHIYTYCTMGTALERIEEKAQAINAYDKAINLDSSYYMVFVNKYMILRACNIYNATVSECAEQIMFLRPDSPITHSVKINHYYNLGLTLEASKEHTGAIESYREAVNVTLNDPMSADIYNRLGLASNRLKDFQLSAHSYQKAIDLNPVNYIYQFNLAITFSNLKQNQKAIDAFDKAIVLFPGEYFRGHYELSYIYYLEKNTSKALKHCQRAIEIAPKNPNPCKLIANIYEGLHCLSEALKYNLKANNASNASKIDIESCFTNHQLVDIENLSRCKDQYEIIGISSDIADSAL